MMVRSVVLHPALQITSVAGMESSRVPPTGVDFTISIEARVGHKNKKSPDFTGLFGHLEMMSDYCLAALVVLRLLLSAAEIPGNREINSEFFAFRYI
jgi:hypothetical protein